MAADRWEELSPSRWDRLACWLRSVRLRATCVVRGHDAGDQASGAFSCDRCARFVDRPAGGSTGGETDGA